MIINIPTSEDFISTGTDLLNLSWDIVIGLIGALDEAEDYGVDMDEVVENYWIASRQKMMNALAIAQQGAEFIMKGKICEISPFLLLSNGPKDWPKQSMTVDTDFADFKMVDSQDLVKLHNAVSVDPLDERFVQEYKSLRRTRNAIIHTIDHRVEIHAETLAINILRLFKRLMAGESWIKERRKYLELSNVSQVYSPDHVEGELIEEMIIIFKILSPKLVKELFGINSRQRRYICPFCASNTRKYFSDTPETAVLRPNTPNSEKLFCFICEKDIPVKRIDCADSNCKGNVMMPTRKGYSCSTCGMGQA